MPLTFQLDIIDEYEKWVKWKNKLLLFSVFDDHRVCQHISSDQEHHSRSEQAENSGNSIHQILSLIKLPALS
jgi:hypothetical protein